MRLTSDKSRKEVCVYEEMCAYKKGALNNPSLWHLVLELIRDECEGLLCMYVMADSWLVSFG
jgi:hypothetical protein